MIAEWGHFALVLALAISLVQATVPLAGVWRNDLGLMRLADGAASATFLCLFGGFLALVWGYVTSDFSVLNVYENSHSQQPMLYKITSSWGNHEGSMLLWIVILALFSALVAWFGGNLPASLKANVLVVQGWIATSFLLFLLLTSNPFERVASAEFEGRDLNPLLQDIGLAIHPPLLYLGYVGFSVCFSFAVAALMEGRLDAAWARWVRPWTLAAWVFLTAGIAMGSYWAYYELGWGGWWFWDPVENASFMPWLAGTALLHSALVMEKRETLKVWTILLAIITFSLSLLGTFLVRSGVLTSVHAFASDPVRGQFILIILALFIGGSLTLFAARSAKLKSGGIFAPISREGALVLNNLLLSSALLTVLVGTLYPLVLETLTGDRISVGPPFFNATFGPLMLPLLVAVPFGPLLTWKRGDLLGAAQRLYAAFGAALAAFLLVVLLVDPRAVFAALGIALGAWVIVGAFCEFALRIKLFAGPLGTSLRRAAGLPRAQWGTTLAHAGLGVTMLGIVSVVTWEQEFVARMQVGDVLEGQPYQLTLVEFQNIREHNYTDQRVLFTITRNGAPFGDLAPARRVFTARSGSPTTETAILTRGFTQVYASLGEFEDAGTVIVRFYVKPQVLLIWIGALIMVAAGTLSLTDRRLRVGAPKRARQRHPVPEPAE